MANIAERQWVGGKVVFGAAKICSCCGVADDAEYLGGTGKRPTYTHRACVGKPTASTSASAAPVARRRSAPRASRSRDADRCSCANCRRGAESLCLVDR